METRANHVLIGAFALATSIFLVLFALWAAKYASDRSWDEYQIVFTEAVTGLTRGGIVQYNGIAVGEVRELSLDRNDPGKVIARIRVEAGTPVKTDTTAKLAFVGLTGVTQIQLSGGSLSSRMLMETVPKGERPTILASESAIAKLLASSEDITTTASDVLLRLNRMLSDENTRHISATLANLDQVTGALAAERGEIAGLIRDARAAAGKLDTLMARADGAVGKLDNSLTALDRDLPRILRNLDRTLVQLEGLSRNANGLVEDNREAVDHFAQQGLGQLGPTLTELRSLLRQLNRVAARVEDSPSNAILGGPAREEFKP